MFEGPAGVLKKAESKPVCHIKGRNSYRYPVQVVHLFLMLSQVNNCVWKVLYLCNISSVYVCLYMYVCGTWINGWSLDLCSLGRQTTPRMLRKNKYMRHKTHKSFLHRGTRMRLRFWYLNSEGGKTRPKDTEREYKTFSAPLSLGDIVTQCKSVYKLRRKRKCTHHS